MHPQNIPMHPQTIPIAIRVCENFDRQVLSSQTAVGNPNEWIVIGFAEDGRYLWLSSGSLRFRVARRSGRLPGNAFDGYTTFGVGKRLAGWFAEPNFPFELASAIGSDLVCRTASQ